MRQRKTRDWPERVADRRVAFEARTADGDTCTLLLIRHAAGPLVLYFHAAVNTSAVLTPELYATLLAELGRLAE